MNRIFKTASLLSIVAAMSLSSSSCIREKTDIIPDTTTKPPVVIPTTGKMQIKFNYVFGHNELPFSMNTQFVHPMTGDTMTFTLFRFYVSNIKLKKADGSWWIHPDSYFLVDAKSTSESTLAIDNVPNGSYTEMEYTMGVDSIMNVSGAHEGALSFTNAMFWDWNSGYIMLKAEGNSPNSPSGTFALHLGGFSGATNIVTVKTTDFSGDKLNINSSDTRVVKLKANPARLWHSSPALDSIYVIHAPGYAAQTMAKDFYNAIIYTGME
ncbi:MAG: hypothetical protein H6550_09640 [Chitinophagales bacterium]|nr:hypothetical protein [Chitinophagales bacterium]